MCVQARNFPASVVGCEQRRRSGNAVAAINGRPVAGWLTGWRWRVAS